MNSCQFVWSKLILELSPEIHDAVKLIDSFHAEAVRMGGATAYITHMPRRPTPPGVLDHMTFQDVEEQYARAGAEQIKAALPFDSAGGFRSTAADLT